MMEDVLVKLNVGLLWLKLWSLSKPYLLYALSWDRMITCAVPDLSAKSQIEILYKMCQKSETELGIWLIFTQATELKMALC